MAISNHPIETPPRAPSPVHRFGTLAVHAGSPHDPVTGAVIESISLSTTFAQTAVGKPVGEFEYARSSNPNRNNFEKAIAALEHAKYALAFSSGSATTAVILQSLAAGSHVISVSDVVRMAFPCPLNPRLRLCFTTCTHDQCSFGTCYIQDLLN
jgi:cystathionine gamma-lyase